MSILPLLRRADRPAPRHSVHSRPVREITPREAAAHADAMQDIAAALRNSGSHPYPEPAAMTAASAEWAGAADPAMEIHHEAEAGTTLFSNIAPRAYIQPRTLLPAIPLDAEIRLRVRALIASGAYEDIDAFADQSQRRMQRRCDRAQWHARQTLTAGWRQITALAAGLREAA